MGAPWIAVIVTQWVIIVLLCAVCLGILRYLAVFRERMDLAAPPTTALNIHDRIPDLEFEQLATHTPFTIPRGRSCLLVFVTATCGSCRNFLAQVDDIVARGRRNDQIDLALVVLDDHPDDFITAWPRLSTSENANTYA